LGACSRLRRYHRVLCFNIFALRSKKDFRVAPWRIFRVYPIESELLKFSYLWVVQNEIDGILSPNNIWPRVFFPWEQNIGSRLPIMMSQSPKAYKNHYSAPMGLLEYLG
jgi:hypothetical protein